MLHEAILWYGGCGLFMWQLLPLGRLQLGPVPLGPVTLGPVTQLAIEFGAALLFVVLAVRAIRAKRPFIVAGNAMLAFLYLFPFVVSTFGEYIGP